MKSRTQKAAIAAISMRWFYPRAAFRSSEIGLHGCAPTAARFIPVLYRAVAKLIFGPLCVTSTRRRRPSGSRRTRRAWSRSSGAASKRSASRATTTRSWPCGLKPGQTYEYEVALDGERAWPEPDSPFPPSVIRPIDPDGTIEIVVRLLPRRRAPPAPPTRSPRTRTTAGASRRALRACAGCGTPARHWPHLLLNIGDQVYADEDAPQHAGVHQSADGTSRAAARGCADFEEYTRLYWESWGDPTLRWLLSTVSTRDDLRRPRRARRLEHVSGLARGDARNAVVERAHRKCAMSYWIYQHLGNLSPRELDEIGAARALKHTAGRRSAATRVRRAGRPLDQREPLELLAELGRTKILVFDSREGRVLEEGTRQIVDDAEWEWVEQVSTGDFDHLLLVDTLPGLLTPAVHYLEAWNEAVCAGAWGKAMQPLGERVRRALDLEHWAAFGDSFHKLVELVTQVAAGERGRAPATVLLLGGDVHHAYLAEVGFPRRRGRRAPSTRPSARPSGTRSTPASDSSCVRGRANRSHGSLACWRAPQAYGTRRSAGDCCRARLSTTSSARSSFRAATPSLVSSAPFLGTTSGRASRRRSSAVLLER